MSYIPGFDFPKSIRQNSGRKHIRINAQKVVLSSSNLLEIILPPQVQEREQNDNQSKTKI